MKYFPPGPGARSEVMALLAAMVDTPENLEWFRVTLRDHVSEWPGLGEIRAIYCSSKRPADGIEGAGYSTTPGFTAEEIARENLRGIAPFERRLGGKPLRKLEASMLDKPIDDDKPN